MRGRRPYTDKDDAAIIAGRAAGKTYAVIASSLGRTTASVSGYANFKLGLGKKQQRANRRSEPGDYQGKPRACLSCNTRFKPRHRLVFICGECKRSEGFQYAAGLP